MIRGPTLPLLREGLWRLVRERPELIERNLRVIAEGLEPGTDELGLVDGLLRDAGGCPVLLFATDDRERALPARVVAAHAFWLRNAAGLPKAIPEADLRFGAPCRLLIVGTGLALDVLPALDRLQLPALEILEVEAFHLSGQERLVVRTIRGSRCAAAASAASAGGADDPVANLFAPFEAVLRTLDPDIRIDGDRYSRRASFAGQSLGECWFAGDRLRGAAAGGAPRVLQGDADLRKLVDEIARQYLARDGDARGRPATDGTKAMAASAASARGGFDALRASVGAARLSREECTALGEGEPCDDGEEGSLAGG